MLILYETFLFLIHDLTILYDQHSHILVLSYKLHTNFLHLFTFILSGKNSKS